MGSDRRKRDARRRTQRLEQGLCVNCGIRRHIKKCTLCLRCRRRYREAMARYTSSGKRSVRGKRYYQRNKRKILARTALWLKKNHSTPRYRRLHRIRLRRHWTKHRKRVVELLGGECRRCRFTDFRCLQVDHVRGGGNKEARRFGRHAIWSRIVRWGSGRNRYQLLCSNCNWFKRYERGE